MSKPKAGLIAMALKLGPKIGAFLLKALKGLKVGKVGFAAASLATYSYMYTWQFACIILFMLFVHENGHIWAMKRCGMKTKGIYFIPFFGAAAVTDEEFKSRNDESYIAIMGPIWGLALSAATACVYLITHRPFFAAAASWMAMINLFNLVPVNPLDGGRIMKSIAFSLHTRIGHIYLFVGLGVAAVLGFKLKIGLLIFLLIVGSIELFFEIWGRARRNAKLKLLREQFANEMQHTINETEPKFLLAIEAAIEQSGVSPEEAQTARERARAHAAQLREQHLTISESLKEPSEPPKMDRRQMVTSITIYFLVAAVLLGIMFAMNHVPGAAAAMELLKDN